MKKFLLLVFALSLGVSSLLAGWNTRPPGTTTVGATVSVNVSGSVLGNNQISFLMLWVQTPNLTWTSYILGSSAVGTITGSRTVTMTAASGSSSGTWNWDVRVAPSSGGSSPSGTACDTAQTTVGTPITAATIASLTYNGTAQSPSSVSSVTPGGATVSVTAPAQTNAGTYNTGTVTGTGSYSGTLSGQNWTINPAPTNFSLNTNSFTYNGGAQGPTVVPSVGGATFTTGGTLSATAAGSYTATATANGNYSGSNAALTWSINAAGQTISFANPGAQTFGTPLTLSATASSGLAVGFNVVSGPATLAGNVLTFTGVGSVTVQATQAGNANFSAAAPVNQTFTVNPRPVTFSLNQTAFTYTGSAQGPSVVPSVGGATFTTGGTLSAAAVSSYTATATANGNYTGSNAALTWSINAAGQTISFANPGAQTFGTPLTLSATASSGLAVGFIVVSGPATLAGNVLTFTGVGSVTVQATQAGNANFSAASPVNQTFTVNPRPVTFSLNQTAFTFTGSAQGPTVVPSVGGATFTTGGTLSATAVSSYTATATANGNYTGSNAALTWSINAAGQTISFANPGAQTFGTPLTLSATASSGLTVGFSVVSGPATLAGNVLTFTGVGSVTVQATQAGNANFSAAAPVNQTFTVNPRPVTFSLNQTAFTFTGGAQGPTVVPSVGGATFTTGGTLSAAAVSSYTATATANGNYTGSNAALTWSIGKANQTITFANPGTKTFGTPLTLTATASSGLTVSYTVTSGPATVAGNVVTFTGTGSVTITASQAGNTSYNAATNVAQTFSVNPAPTTFALSQTAFTFTGAAQGPTIVPTPSGATFTSGGTLSATAVGSYTATATANGNYTGSNTTLTWTIAASSQTITFANPGTKTFGTPLTLTATASSGLTVSYAVTSGPATVAGNVVTFTGIGSVTIRAAQAGNASYGAAVPVNQTFTVNAAPTTFALNTTAFAYTGVAQGPTIVPTPSGATFASGGTLSATAVGSYTATATANGNYTGTNTALTWSIGKANQTITFANPGTKTFGTPLTLTATASSGLTVSYAVTSGPATVAGNVVTFTGTGSVTITASQAGNTTYNAATSVPQTFTVTAPAPVITSPTTANGQTGSAFSYQISASSSPTSYSASALPAGLSFNTSTGLISGTPTKPGVYTVTIGATNAGGSTSIVLTLTILATLPYTTDFETAEGYAAGTLNLQLGWSITQGMAVVTTLDHVLGAQCVQLASGSPVATITQSFANSAGQTIEFFDFFAKPVAESSLASATTFTVEGAKFAFLLSGSQGILQVYSGNGSGGGTWQATTAPFAITVNAGSHQAQSWVGLTVRLDFTAHKWDLYANGTMVAADIPFINNASTYLSTFQMQGDTAATSVLDDIYAGPINPLFADSNNNGLADTWETAHGLSLATNNRNTSPTNNGVTVLQAYVAGTNPNDIFNGSAPTLIKLGGDNQIGLSRQFNLLPFDMGVYNTAGTTALINAPVTFTVQSGGGKLALINTGTPTLYTTLPLNTDSLGTAVVYYQQPIGNGVTSTILFTAGTGQATFTTLSAVDSDGDGIPDVWEIAYGLNPNDPADAAYLSAAALGTGKNNLQAYQTGLYAVILNLQNAPMPVPATGGAYQLVMMTPRNAIYGVKADWELIPLPVPAP